jgi:hypothetical protein
MKPILSTRLARTMDGSVEGGAVDLLSSILLHEKGHTFILPEDRELRRGIFISPTKSGREPKYIR